MKKFLPPAALTLILALSACGPSAEKLNNQGNEAFNHQDFAGALAAYQQAQAESPRPFRFEEPMPTIARRSMSKASRKLSRVCSKIRGI